MTQAAKRIVRSPEHPAWNPRGEEARKPDVRVGIAAILSLPSKSRRGHRQSTVLTSNMSTVTVAPKVKVSTQKWRGQGKVEVTCYADRARNMTAKVYDNAGRNGRKLAPKLAPEQAGTEKVARRN